jgi:3',5'-cyclic AMP phosphodiesterase CpdA
VGAWRAIGINAQLLGSGLPEEADQMAWLEAQLDSARAPVALFLHKPLFLSTPDETEATASCTTPGPRAILLALLKKHGVRFVISGHLHCYRDETIDGIRYLWLPATSFIGQGYPGSRPIVGVVSIDVSTETEIVMLHHPKGMQPIDLVALKGHGQYAFIRDMPVCPPDEAA